MSQSCSFSAENIMEEPAIRQGVYVTAGYMLVFYAGLIGQTIAKHKVASSYRARGERVSRKRTSARVGCAYAKRFYAKRFTA